MDAQIEQLAQVGCEEYPVEDDCGWIIDIW